MTSGSPGAGRDGDVTDALVDAWCTRDRSHAFLRTDGAAIDATRPLRDLVVESLLFEPDSIGRDLLHALGALGRGMADANASPTLASSTVDTLVAVEARLRPPGTSRGPAFVLAARAALFESYVLALSARHAEEARRTWDYPACAVPVQEGVVAIAAGHPVDDEEALTAWASRVVHAIALAGVRQAVVAGAPAAVRTLAEALDVAGIELLTRVKGLPATPRASSR